MRVLVVEENSGPGRALYFKLNNIPGVGEIIEVRSFSEGLRVLNSEKVDVAFISEEIEGKSVFDLLEAIESRDFELVLVAKTSDLALKSIKYNPKGFLIKPVSQTELTSLIEELIDQKGGMDRPIVLPIDKIQEESILLKIARGYSVFKFSEIEKITAFGAYSKVHLVNGAYHVVNGNLAYLESALKGKVFFRIHSSTIVNFNHVRSFVKDRNDGKIIMKKGEELRVSRTHKDKMANIGPIIE